jgi:hypothetical protein
VATLPDVRIGANTHVNTKTANVIKSTAIKGDMTTSYRVKFMTELKLICDFAMLGSI